MQFEGPDISVKEVLQIPFDYSAFLADNDPVMFYK